MDLDWERTKLLQRDAEWASLASEGRDVEAILSYWTDDAVVLPPGLPAVIGKTALRAYVEGSMQIPGFIITWSSSDVVFSLDESLAYMFSDNSVTMNGADGEPATAAGRAGMIWRREQDGHSFQLTDKNASVCKVAGHQVLERRA